MLSAVKPEPFRSNLLLVSVNDKMPEADVVYSDIKFTNSKGNTTGTASLPAESIYSEVRISKNEPSTELTGSQQQAVPNGGSKVTSERVAIAVLGALLAAAAIGLGFVSYENSQTMERLQQLTAVNKNLTERRCEVKTCNTVPETCPQPPTEPCLKCQEGWEQHERQCYYFSTDAKPWKTAREECSNQGGALVKIDSRKKQAFLQQKLRGKMKKLEDKFWIGLTDSVNEGEWLWVDGSPLNNSLTFWSYKEPDDWKKENPDGEDCVRMGEKGSANLKCWFDKSCKAPHRSICEKPAESGHLKCV